MAYPTVSAPYGLIPVKLIGGQVFAGQVREMPIASAYATAIYCGDVVKRVNDGTVALDTGTTTATPVGVFQGCRYTDPSTGQITFKQSWPASTVASDAVAFVADDPDLVFKVALVSGTTVIAGLGKTVIGTNLALVQNTGSTINGRSAVAALTTSSATTVSLPLRVVDVVRDTATGSDTFVEVLVKWNEPYLVLSEGTPNTVVITGGHAYKNPTGV
jgi:hypothetical protein